jgi:hypothetical protein
VQPLTADQRSIFNEARRGAKRREIPFHLSEKDLEILVARAAGRCEMTGVPFSNDRLPNQRIREFRMSIDRLENDQGYALGNCRLVCAFVNLARGPATLEVADLFFLEYERKMGAIIPDGLVVARDGDRWEY